MWLAVNMLYVVLLRVELDEEKSVNLWVFCYRGPTKWTPKVYARWPNKFSRPPKKIVILALSDSRYQF
jgi:hypothetical protein